MLDCFLGFKNIIERIQKRIGISSDCEITVEMDPGTFDLQKMRDLVKLGVNRVSLGVQSFDDKVLEISSRVHRYRDVLESLDILQQCDLHNYNVDIISSLPYTNLDYWKSTLSKIIELRPPHISCYDLQIEDKTAFAVLYRKGRKPLPTNKISAKMYEMASEYLTSAGYDHYEISNYALPSFQSRHNRGYWNGNWYWGFGMSASSYFFHQRCTRPSSLLGYKSWIDGDNNDNNNNSNYSNYSKNNGGNHRNYSDASFNPVTGQENITSILKDYVMLSLRTSDGISRRFLSQHFGPTDYYSIIKKCLLHYEDDGYISIQSIKDNDDNDDEVCRLTDPSGFLFSNMIISDIFSKLSN